MSEFTVHFVFLHQVAGEQTWSYLNDYFHPGAIKHEEQIMIVGKELDLSHHVFTKLSAKNWLTKKVETIYLPYSLISGIKEIISKQKSFGFLSDDQSIKNIEL